MHTPRTMQIHCADIIGYQPALHPEAAHSLALAVAAHLSGSVQLTLNLSGVPSFSPIFIRTFWNQLTKTISPVDIHEHLHIHTSSYTLQLAFDEQLSRLAHRYNTPRLQPLAS